MADLSYKALLNAYILNGKYIEELAYKNRCMLNEIKMLNEQKNSMQIGLSDVADAMSLAYELLDCADTATISNIERYAEKIIDKLEDVFLFERFE